MANTEELERKIELLKKRKFELKKFILDLSILISEFTHSSDFKDIPNNKHQTHQDDL